MAYLTSSDNIGILSIVAIFIVSGMLYSARAIDLNTLIMVFFGVFGFIVAKFAVPLTVAGIVKKIYGKGMAAYWNEIRKELRESPREYDFSFDLMIPENYMPKHAIPLPHYDLVLFEINRDDMQMYAGERLDILTFPYHYLTILYRPSSNVILGIKRGATLDATVEFIERHKEAFLKEGKEMLLPRIIRETQFGQGLEVKTAQPEGR